MRLYDLLNNEGTNLEKDEKDFLEKLYEDKGTHKHFVLKNPTDILLFLKKYDIKIYDEEPISKIYKENFENNEDFEKAFSCDLFRNNGKIPIFDLYFKVNNLFYKPDLNTEYMTYKMKHISFI